MLEKGLLSLLAPRKREVSIPQKVSEELTLNFMHHQLRGSEFSHKSRKFLLQNFQVYVLVSSSATVLVELNEQWEEFKLLPT